MAESNTSLTATLSGKTGKTIGIALLAGGVALGAYAIYKGSKKSQKALSGVGGKRKKKKHQSAPKKKAGKNKSTATKKAKRQRLLLKGF